MMKVLKQRDQKPGYWYRSEYFRPDENARIDVRNKNESEPYLNLASENGINWDLVIEWRYTYSVELPVSSKPFANPALEIPHEKLTQFNCGNWIKFIPGDLELWRGHKIDVKYLTGESASCINASSVNWDTVAKYRKHTEPQVRPVAPRSVPEGYVWTNPNLTYLSYVEAGWTLAELIDVKFLQPVETHDFSLEFKPFEAPKFERLNPSIVMTPKGTEVDPNSRYYDAGGIETIEIIKAKLTPEQLKGYLLGNVIKYSSRLNFKGTAVRDAEKLKFYANWLEQLK